MAKKKLTNAELKGVHDMSIRTRIKKALSSFSSNRGDKPLPTRAGKRQRVLRDKSKAGSSDDPLYD